MLRILAGITPVLLGPGVIAAGQAVAPPAAPAAAQPDQRIELPLRLETDTDVLEFQFFYNGVPKYYVTLNEDAADSVSTDECQPGGASGYGLTGSGVTLGVWDAGAVRASHQEFGGRVTQVDGASSTHYHSTHVAGTMIASGVVAAARGMSPAADLDCWEWNNDTSEMRSAAGSGLLVSNHSYSFVTGWYYNSSYGEWFWYGDVTVSTTEDNWFGLYTDYSAELDDIARDYPYYLICRSAGNDRNDDGPGPGGGHYYYHPSNGWTWSTATRDPDGPWDCIGTNGVAKNILTVAAVEDVIGGYDGPGSVDMSYFSSWGPADDGRIKPDISGNGVGLYSTMNNSNTAYDTLSGTSMSSPNVAGSLGLLIDQWRDTHAGDMRSATLKGLALHTADECGPGNGPDYMYGWGLLNTWRAADVIVDDGSVPLTITEQTISTGGTIELYATSDGSSSELRATICWTDPPGTPPGNLLNPTTPALVNDLDLRIEASGGALSYPWILDPTDPSAAATTGDNFRDNVEQVVVYNPGTGSYTIRVTPSGALSGGSQAFSLVISGAASISDTPGGYTLTVNTSGQGSVVLDPPGGTYSPGTVVELEAIADAGWHFDQWTGALTGSTNPETLTMDGDKTVTAVFEQDSYTLTVNVTGQGSVVLTPPGGVYLSGTVVELEAIADAGWHFDHWTGALTGSTNPETLTMDGDKTVTAVFEQNSYFLTITSYPLAGVSVQVAPPDANGNGDGVTAFQRRFYVGTGVTLTAPLRPQVGIETLNFVYWLVDGVPQAEDEVSLLHNVMADAALEVEYVILGDMNGDNMVNNADIPAFVLALTDRDVYIATYGLDADKRGDFDGDGELNNGDIPGFVARLSGE